jgi:hypothetical protein
MAGNSHPVLQHENNPRDESDEGEQTTNGLPHAQGIVGEPAAQARVSSPKPCLRGGFPASKTSSRRLRILRRRHSRLLHRLDRATSPNVFLEWSAQQSATNVTEMPLE